MPTSDPNFARRLKELRAAAGMTQPQLADKAGVSKGTVAALEQGAYDATWPTVQALAAALGVDCGAFGAVAIPAPPTPRGRPRKDAGAGEKPAEVKPAPK